GELEAVLVAEREIRDALADEPRAGIERRLDHAETIRLEHVVGGLAVSLDLELLQPAQHVEILLAALDQQQVAALQRQICLGHDRQLALAEEREQAKVERVREAAAGERAAGERRVARHTDDEDALLQPIDLAQLLLADLPRRREIRGALELGLGVRARLEQQDVPGAERHLRQIYAAHEVAAADREHVRSVALAKVGMRQQRADERGAFVDRRLDERDLAGHQTLQHGSLPL